MEITRKDIFQSKELLPQIYQTEMKAQDAWEILRLKEAIDDELAEIEKQRVRLVKKYGEDDGAGNITVDPENESLFYAEFDSLLKKPLNINYKTLSINVIEQLRITPEQLDLVKWMFREDVNNG